LGELHCSAKKKMTYLVTHSVIWLTIAAVVAVKANNRDRGLHGKAKAVSFLCVAFIILFHSTAFSMLNWAFGHPQQILPYFYVTKDLFAPWASLTVWILNTIMSVAAVLLGFGIARRKNRSRLIFLRFLPLIAFVDWLEMFKGTMSQPRTTGAYLTLGGMTALFIIVPYALIALYYTRTSVKDALFSEGTAEPAGTDNSRAAPLRV
jgi:hypothetical protein